METWQMAMMGLGGVLLVLYFKRRSDRISRIVGGSLPVLASRLCLALAVLVGRRRAPPAARPRWPRTSSGRGFRPWTSEVPGRRLRARTGRRRASSTRRSPAVASRLSSSVSSLEAAYPELRDAMLRLRSSRPRRTTSKWRGSTAAWASGIRRTITSAQPGVERQRSRRARCAGSPLAGLGPARRRPATCVSGRVHRTATGRRLTTRSARCSTRMGQRTEARKRFELAVQLEPGAPGPCRTCASPIRPKAARARRFRRAGRPAARRATPRAAKESR